MILDTRKIVVLVGYSELLNWKYAMRKTRQLYLELKTTTGTTKFDTESFVNIL